MKKLCIVSAPVATRSGYGDHSRDLVHSLIKQKGSEWDIKILSQRWGSCPMNALNSSNEKDKVIIEHLYLSDKLTQQPDIWIQVTVPNEFRPIGKFNIGITAGIETTLCAPEWIEGLNRMDLNIVPSKHSRDIFLNTTYQKVDEHTKQPISELKCIKPIEILFEGLDLDVFKKTDELPKTIVDEINNIPEDFCFLSVGHWLQGELGHDRKDIGMMIKTFLETYKNTSNPPALIIKTSGATFSILDRDDILNKISRIRKTVNGMHIPNVYLIHGDLTPLEMNGLYNHPKVKAMISFTHGEGFGRPLLEFMVTGKPLIAPNWSGHIDFVNSKYSTLLPGNLTKIHKSAVWDKVLLKDSQWFVVNYDYASKIIKDISNDYKKYLEMSRGSWHYVKTNFDLDTMDKQFGQILERYFSQHPERVELNLPKESKLKITLPELRKV
jgi:glycosyltransferase involved in cell wall biosynthesis